MEGESLVEALRDRKAGEDSGVVGATSHDHLGTALESLHKGLLTHLSDDVDGLVNVLVRQLRYGTKRADATLLEIVVDRLLVKL